MNASAVSIKTTRATTFGRERIVDVLEEIKPLLEAHYREISYYPDIPLDPDYDRYRALEQTGALRIFTARSNGVLVGYAIFFVGPAPHYRGSLRASQDVLFLHPDCRRGGVGMGLIRFAEHALKAEGVQIVMHHQKVAHPTLGTLLRRMGYEAQDILWTKRLDR